VDAQANSDMCCCKVAVCPLAKRAHCSAIAVHPKAEAQHSPLPCMLSPVTCAVCDLQGLKRCHSGSEVQGDLCQQEPSLKRLCGPRAMGPPPQLVLPSDQPFMADEPLLPAGATTTAAASYSMWRTGLTPRVGHPAAWGGAKIMHAAACSLCIHSQWRMCALSFVPATSLLAWAHVALCLPYLVRLPACSLVVCVRPAACW
jgi:hypothetical protein